MALRVRNISTKSELKKFIKFPSGLYKDVPQYVPPIISFELSTLQKDKNPAFNHCKAEYWMVERNGKPVGRIAGIIHQQELKDKALARIGWIDFEDDAEVFDLLINTVEDWALENKATGIHGPLGFTDLDFEGTLIKGFDQVATQATIYNFPYYQTHFERRGFGKACDWVELRGRILVEMPRRLERKAQIISERFKLTPKKFKKSKEILKYGREVFEIINDTYSHLYGYYPLTEQQIDYYIDLYFGFVRKEYISIVLDEKGRVAAFALSLPSFSEAFRKAKGSLFPFGFIHVLKALKGNEQLDLLLICARPKYQKVGASVLIFHQLFKTYMENKVKILATGPMLDDNFNVLNLWNEYLQFDKDYIELRRRCFIKPIGE